MYGMAELIQSQLLQLGTSTMTTVFERGRKGVIKTFSGTHADVRRVHGAGQRKDIFDQREISEDSNAYVHLLQECIKMKDLQMGKQVHANIIHSDLEPRIFLLNNLINMYAKCGSLTDARQLFDEMPERDVFAWTIMVAGYAQHGCGREAFEIYKQMIREGVMPNRVTFICVVKACASLGALEKAKEVHGDIVKAGIPTDIILETALADMYAKCGSVQDARQVFDNMAQRNAVSWSALITGYVQHGCDRDAFEIYEQMIKEGVRPDRVAFVCILNACASIGDLERGKMVHADIMKVGIVPDIILDTALVDMYAKCGRMNSAHQMFDDMPERNVFTWSAMITGFAKQGGSREALEIYEQMQQEGVMPDEVTFICVLDVCGRMGALERGKKVHADIIQAAIAPHIILETSLVDMYAKCGSMDDAQQVFNNMAKRNVVSWSAIIAGYARHACGKEALMMYGHMQQEGWRPDRVTFICVLNACASLAALEMGKEVHADIIKAGIAPDVVLETALADMYAKCGRIQDARQVFDNMALRNVVSWNMMIAGYAQHGCGREALELFEQMQPNGSKPDGITFICLLSACSHVGLVDEGCHYFDSMSRDHGLTSTVEHFGCMVDLFARAGRLDEAEDVINNMPIEPDASLWGALLGACRIHGDVERGERVAKCLLRYPQHGSAHVLH